MTLEEPSYETVTKGQGGLLFGLAIFLTPVVITFWLVAVAVIRS